MILNLMAQLRCHFQKVTDLLTQLVKTQNTTLIPLEPQCVSVDGADPVLATPASVWDDVLKEVTGTIWLDEAGKPITGAVVVTDFCKCLEQIKCCEEDQP